MSLIFALLLALNALPVNGVTVAVLVLLAVGELG